MRDELYQALLCGNSCRTEVLAKEALSAGEDPVKLVYEIVIPAIEEVGRRFDCAEYFVPELLIATRAANCALNVFKPALEKLGQKTKGCVVAGTVAGELHDIGIRIISLMNI